MFWKMKNVIVFVLPFVNIGLWIIVENYSHFWSALVSKNNRTYNTKQKKNKQKNKCVCIHEITWLIIMKMKMKMKKRLHRYDINGPRSKDGHKYCKYKKCLSMMMLICIKHQLSNIWSSIHEKVKHHWGWVEKKALLIEKSV